MSVLKIKDQNNDWIQISTIKGDKGDPFTYADFTPEQLESLKGKDGISPTVSVASDTSEDYRLSFTDETHTVTTPNLIPEAEKFLSAYPTDTASGSIASFPDGADNIPLKSCIVQVEPVQAGSGDPSPENVRPITGWTGVEVQRTGKNLLSISPITETVNDITFTVNNDGTISLSGIATKDTYYYLSIGKRSFPNGSFVLSGCPSGGNSSTYRLRIDGATGKSIATDYGNGAQFTIADGKVYSIFINVKSGVNTDGLVFKLMVELGSTVTPYEPYTANTYPITFPSEAGTVYGAYVDVVNGELVVDRAQIASYNGETLPSTWISDRDVYASGTTPTIGAQVVYKLAAPIHYPITSNRINSLYGQNNLWANTGDTEVEYRADVTKYIDRKITEAVSALT